VVAAAGTAFLAISLAALELAHAGDGARRLTKITTSYIIVGILGVLIACWRGTQEFPPKPAANHFSWHFLLLVIAIAVVCELYRHGIRDSPMLNHRVIAVLAFLAFVPLIFSFGTNMPIVYPMTQASVFFAADALLLALLAKPDRRRALLTTTAALCSVVTVGMLVGTMAAPYSIAQPMWMQTDPISLGRLNSKLLVDKPTARYIGALQQYARTNQFQAAMPIVDLSGLGPGIVFALAGKAPVSPWLFLHSPARIEYTRAVLGLVRHSDLTQAWILTRASTPDVQEMGLIRLFGLQFPSDYVAVGSVHRTDLFWSQTLWKPRLNRQSR
jgi:hypothetical protein